MDGQLSEQYNLASYLISFVDHNMWLPFVSVFFDRRARNGVKEYIHQCWGKGMSSEIYSSEEKIYLN